MRVVEARQWGRSTWLLRLADGASDPTQAQLDQLAAGLSDGTDGGAVVRVLDVLCIRGLPDLPESDPLDDWPGTVATLVARRTLEPGHTIS